MFDWFVQGVRRLVGTQALEEVLRRSIAHADMEKQRLSMAYSDMEKRFVALSEKVSAQLKASAELEDNHQKWTATTARQLSQIRTDAKGGSEKALDTFVKRIDRLEGQVQRSSAASTEKERQQLAWIKDIAHTVAESRAEMRLLIEAPGAPAGIGDDNGDPQVLRRYIKNANIRELYPTDLFEKFERMELPLGTLNEESGHANQVDLMYVVAIAKAREAKSIFEFGTYQGRTTYHLTFASKDARVTTLNLPPELCPDIAPFLGIMFKGSDREDRITQVFGDSLEFDPAPFEGKMDFVFIDANHSYEYVKNDTEKALTMLRRGGVIVWHDFAHKSPGVVKFISEFSKTHPVFRLKHTCLIVYIDGVDSMAFQPRPRRPSLVSKAAE